MKNLTTSYIEIDETLSEIRLDRLIREKFDLSQAFIEKLLKAKSILVNSVKSNSNYRTKIGDKISIKLANHIKKNDEIKIIDNKFIKLIQNAILYKDDDILIINKPSGIAVQGGSGIKFSIDDILPNLQFEKPEKPRLVHRLDKETSGLLMIARTRKSAIYLANLFQNSKIKKQYLAIVSGELPFNKQTLKHKIEKDVKYEKMVENENGKLAISHYELKNKINDNLSLLLLMPETGRTHQLRFHMGKINCPILGDKKYGSNYKSNKLFLHAYSLEFVNSSGKKMIFTAEIPDYFNALMPIGIKDL